MKKELPIWSLPKFRLVASEQGKIHAMCMCLYDAGLTTEETSHAMREIAELWDYELLLKPEYFLLLICLGVVREREAATIH